MLASLGVGYWWMDHLPPLQTTWVSSDEELPLVDADPSRDVRPEPSSGSKSLRLHFLKDWSFSKEFKWQNKRVGGLSALAFDQKHQLIWALSDDRGLEGPPRIYKFQLITEGEFRLNLVDELILRNEKGQVFEPRALDPEGLVLMKDGSFLVVSEGELSRRRTIPPRLIWFDERGYFLKEIAIPRTYFDLEQDLSSYGVENNMAFESLTLTEDERWLYMAPESALLQDGSHASFEAGALIRIQEFEKDGKEILPTAQLVYQTEPIEHLGQGLQVGMNSLAELIALGQRRFLALERAFLASSRLNVVRLYQVDCLKATEVGPNVSLKDQAFRACTKEKVWEDQSLKGLLQSQQKRVDNLEGMVLFKTENAPQTFLLMVSDNNFSANQFTQFLLFEVGR